MSEIVFKSKVYKEYGRIVKKAEIYFEQIVFTKSGIVYVYSEFGLTILAFVYNGVVFEKRIHRIKKKYSPRYCVTLAKRFVGEVVQNKN